MKDRMTSIESEIVLHQWDEGQNQPKQSENCPS
jgi:hypothetical protein